LRQARSKSKRVPAREVSRYALHRRDSVFTTKKGEIRRTFGAKEGEKSTSIVTQKKKKKVSRGQKRGVRDDQGGKKGKQKRARVNVN